MKTNIAKIKPNSADVAIDQMRVTDCLDIVFRGILEGCYRPRYNIVLNVTPLRVYSSESPIRYLLLSFQRP